MHPIYIHLSETSYISVPCTRFNVFFVTQRENTHIDLFLSSKITKRTVIDRYCQNQSAKNGVLLCMRGVTHENYQKVRHVSKFNEETIYEPLKDEKDRQTEFCGIILQKLPFCLNVDCFSFRQPIHVRLYPKVNSKTIVDRQNTCSIPREPTHAPSTV